MSARTLRLACTLGLLACALASASARAVPIDPDSPTTSWTVVGYPTLIPDFSDDQQTGLSESDIVGDVDNPALFIAFDEASPLSKTDGNIAFRVRLGASRPPTGFTQFFGIGLDANLDGSLDLFLAVDNVGGSDQIGIYDPGTDLNVSPDTTSIVSTPIQSYAEMTNNYDFSLVDGLIDPNATSFDVDGDGVNDYFLTFVIPFQDIVDALIAKGIDFDEDSAFQLVAGTSTQANALNQDLNGPDGETTSTISWTDLGAFSVVFSPSDLLPVPEPDTGSLFGLGLVALALSKRHRTRKQVS